MSEHTKGPWSYRLAVNTESTYYVDGPGQWICNSVVPNSEANARLIAEAPRMFEALEDLIRLTTHICKTTGYAAKLDYHRAAIAKARGGAGDA